MTAGALLREIGEALYGSRWQTELSLDLGVTNRTVRRWVTGETQPSENVWLDLENLLDLRAAEQRRVSHKVRQERNHLVVGAGGVG